jgi:hypothetical protein
MGISGGMGGKRSRRALPPSKNLPAAITFWAPPRITIARATEGDDAEQR